MSEEKKIMLTPEQAIALLVPGDQVHTFLNPAGLLIGADWSREQAEESIREASQREIAGANARAMGHGLVIVERRENPLAPGDERDVIVFMATVEAEVARMERELS